MVSKRIWINAGVEQVTGVAKRTADAFLRLNNALMNAAEWGIEIDGVTIPKI